MNKKILVHLSHFTTLLFGMSLGMVIVIWHQFAGQGCELIPKILLYPVILMVITAVILRIVTMVIFKKNKDMFNC